MKIPRPFQNSPGVDGVVEKHYPGMRAIAGPFGVSSTLPEIQKHEQACCARALRDQQRKDSTAKIIMYGKFAWVIRSAKNWKYDTAEKFRDKTGIKAGRGAKL